LGEIGQNGGKVRVNVIYIWENLIVFGQNQNLASPKKSNFLRLWIDRHRMWTTDL